MLRTSSMGTCGYEVIFICICVLVAVLFNMKMHNIEFIYAANLIDVFITITNYLHTTFIFITYSLLKIR